MRIACVLVPNLAVRLALATDWGLHGHPVVIGGLPFEAKPVYDASPEAVASGVKLGMPLHQAYALCPEARFLPCDEKAYDQAFEKVVNILERYSPVVDIEKLGCAYLDISGIQSEQNLAREILAAITSLCRLSACLGVSSGKFFSRVGAFTTRPEAPVVVRQGAERDFIAPFSVDLLPCSAQTRERLELLGIRFIGELTQFSREALVAQFGSDGVVMHDLAHGIHKSPLIPRAKPETTTDSIRLDSPVVSLIEILEACEVMLGRLLGGVNEQGKLCREVSLRLGFALGMSEERRLALKEPTTSSGTIMPRLRAWLETIRLPSPVVEVGLLLCLTREQGKKLSLWPDNGKTRQELIRTVEKLRLRFGYQPIKKSRAVNPQPILPERRFTLTDILE